MKPLARINFSSVLSAVTFANVEALRRGILVSSLAFAVAGCGYTHEATLSRTAREAHLQPETNLFFDAEEYRLGADNMPFVFRMRDGLYKFGQHRKWFGSSFQSDTVCANALLRFEIKCHADDPGSLFVLSNGVLRLERHGDITGHVHKVAAVDPPELPLDEFITGVGVIGQWLNIECSPPMSLSIHVHKPGAFGTVLGARFKVPEGKTPQCSLIIHEMNNLRFFRYFLHY